VKMMADPMPIAMAQLDLWADQVRLWQHATGFQLPTFSRMV
jgi:hypothetical protein